MEYGVFFADEVGLAADIRGGWGACSPDFRAARMSIDGIGTDVVWLTNIQFVHSSAYNIKAHAFLKLDRYLRNSTSVILRSYMLHNLSPDEQVVYMAKIFYNIMMIYSKYIVCKDIKEINPPIYDLRSGIRESYPEDPIFDVRIRDAIISSVCDYKKCMYERNIDIKSMHSVTVYLPRFLHAKNILGQRYSFGSEYEVLERSNGALGKKVVLAALEEDDAPKLLNVKIKKMDPKIAVVFSEGNGTLVKKRRERGRLRTEYANRQWITHYDYLLFHEHADIDVYEIVKFLNAENFLKEDVNAFLLEENEVIQNSVTCGLFAELLWSGLGIPHNIGQGNADLKNLYVNPVNPFLKAYDRRLCFPYVISAIYNYELVVKGYGYGKMEVLVPHGEEERVLSFVAENNLFFTFNHLNFNKDIQFSSQNEAVRDMQELLYFGDPADIFEVESSIVDIVCC
jgi:hypothetical protein